MKTTCQKVPEFIGAIVTTNCRVIYCKHTGAAWFHFRQLSTRKYITVFIRTHIFNHPRNELKDHGNRKNVPCIQHRHSFIGLRQVYIFLFFNAGHHRSVVKAQTHNIANALYNGQPFKYRQIFSGPRSRAFGPTLIVQCQLRGMPQSN